MAPSPFAPVDLAVLPPVQGVRLAACEAGIRYQGRKDLMLALFAPGTKAAGVLTKSKTASAPVEWCRLQLQHGDARALVVNSGNANAFTGVRGHDAVQITAGQAASLAGCPSGQVFIASTGVIGEPLDPAAFAGHLQRLSQEAGPDSWEDAARAIMTTDTYPKLATAKCQIAGTQITINGIAKGSGMIAPDMATMLAFFFTDANLPAGVLRSLVRSGVDGSFNAITVDSDTSTSDTVLLFATGAASPGGTPQATTPDAPELKDFTKALHDLMRSLAHEIVKDGEGASKFVTVKVEGAEDNRAAKAIALSIANSPLVKTALASGDPNWGRIVMAVGKAGEAADRDRLAIWFGPVRVAHNGEVDPAYQEADAVRYLKNSEITIRTDVGIGGGEAVVWTCDLTHDYISINADYRS